MRQISATIMCLAALIAAPAIAQDTSRDSAEEPAAEESWLPSLLTDTPAEGFDLAVSMARKGVTTTQTDTDILHAVRPNHAHDPQKPYQRLGRRGRVLRHGGSRQ